ncbi:myb/SANT-like DNA-binding domain-containing protein [Phthorimaea operculella]|nr:myb/SANT-like DNA-binding domain-containing protein [Phthorimaea operculella]
MTDRTIASRPSLDQVVAIVDFMEKHPALAQGQLRGLEGRDQSKKLWMQLSRIVNNTTGPTRPMKSWIKYWADKKSSVRAKVQAEGGNATNLTSSIEKKIWDLFLANDPPKSRGVKQESYIEESFFEDDMEQNSVEEPMLSYEEPPMDPEERQTAIMEKLVKVMSDQASAMSQLAHASQANSQAMERLAEASHIQARALESASTPPNPLSTGTRDAATSPSPVVTYPVM